MENLDKFNDANILCVGDVMLDEYVYGEVNRISPEAPIPVLNVTKETIQLGGAGNTARNIAALGAHVTFCSVVGEGDATIEILRLLKNEPRITAYIANDKHRSTIRKTRYIAGSQQMLRADREKVQSLSEDQERALIKLVKEEIPRHDILVLSDYGKGVLTKALLQVVIEAANEAKIPIIVDPKEKSAYYYAGATVITPNVKEFDTLIVNEKNRSIVERARMDMVGYRIENILLTRGSEGMHLIAHNFDRRFTALAHDVYDVSGAGDTVVATLAVALAAGFEMIKAVELSNIAAGIVVGKRGTATVSQNELRSKWLRMMS